MISNLKILFEYIWHWMHVLSVFNDNVLYTYMPCTGNWYKTIRNRWYDAIQKRRWPGAKAKITTQNNDTAPVQNRYRPILNDVVIVLYISFLPYNNRQDFCTACLYGQCRNPLQVGLPFRISVHCNSALICYEPGSRHIPINCSNEQTTIDYTERPVLYQSW